MEERYGGVDRSDRASQSSAIAEPMAEEPRNSVSSSFAMASAENRGAAINGANFSVSFAVIEERER